MSRLSKSFPHAMTPPRPASIDGHAVIGNYCPGFLATGGNSSGDQRRTAIPLIGRWKMMDNLRRTLSAPAAFLALLVGWTLPYHAAAVWSGFVVATFAIPTILPALLGMVPRRLGISHSAGTGTRSERISPFPYCR